MSWRSEHDDEQLPSGWMRVAIADIANIHSGQTPSGIKEHIQPNGDIPWFKVGDMNRDGNERFMDNGENFLTNEAADSLRMRVFPPYTLIFPKRGGAIATNKKRMLRQPACLDLNVMALVLPEESASYIWWWFQTINLAKLSDGSNVPQINNRHIAPLEVPVAPLPEQKRIVSKIEELFSDLDAGVSALERARANLRRYRASVLKSAVEGRLTETWRKANQANPDIEPASELLARILRERRQRWEQQQLATYESKGKKPPKNWQSKYKEPVAPDTASLPELPNGWCWATLKQICLIDVGYAFKSKKFVDEGMRLLRGENLEPGSFRWKNTKYWSLDDVEDYRHLLVNAGEIILAMDRPLVSAGLKIARAKESDTPCLLVQRMARFRFIEPAMTGFVYSACQTREFIKHLVGNQTGTQLPHISGKGIESFVFPLPPIEEQSEIEDEVARQSSIIDDIERQLERDHRRSETLRQCILKSAFEGKLCETESLELADAS